MKKFGLILFVLFLLWQNRALCQQNNLIPNDSLRVFFKYMQKNIRYPTKAKEQNIMGRVVIELTLTKDYIFTDLKLVRSPSASCDREVVRNIENYNKKPHHTNLQLSPGRYKLAVVFDIADDDHDLMNYQLIYDEKNKLIEIPIIGYETMRKTTSG